MASSQVEFASSSPFGCVLRDRNRRDGCKESNVKATHAALQRNIKNFVMDHLNTCISMSSESDENQNNNNNNNQSQIMSNTCSWASKALKNNLRNLRFHNNKEKNESSLATLISPRHSRVLDRWAARQAREMVSTLKNEAELLHTNNNDNNSNKCGSSTSEDSSSEISNRASSLVQIWEKRLNQSNGSKPNTPKSNGRSSPTAATFNNENAFSSLEESPYRGLEAGESFCDEQNGNEESFPDWESDKTTHSDQSVSPRGRWSSSEAAESDRVRVADIIKKLTAPPSPPPSLVDDNDHEGWGSSVTSSPCREPLREGGFTQEHSEHKAFPCSLRVRGRQAFHDLLMQFERDRHGELSNLEERGAVSRFTQRGRIQSLLRLKLLQRGIAANDQSCHKSKPEVNRQPQGSAIMHLRERFSTWVEHRTAVQAEVSSPRARSPYRERVNNTTQFDNSPTDNRLRKDIPSQTTHATDSTESTLISVSLDHNKDEAQPSSDVMLQETCSEAPHDDSHVTGEATPSMTDSNPNEMEDKAKTSNQHIVESSYGDTIEEEEARDQHYAETSYEEIVEEVDEAMDQTYDVICYDWFSEIARPRSYWEERRQAWYREMLDTGSQNEDIYKLLERKPVSNFLNSDLREIMDRLMESHRGTQTHLASIEDDEEECQGLVVALLQERMRSASTPQEGGRDREEKEDEEREEGRRTEEEEEEEEEEKAEEHVGYHEVGDYFNQSSSPTWCYRDNEAGDDFDRVPSTSPQPSQSQYFYQDSQRCSSANHHSIEMELIYDLRGQMEQLYQEMSELRKSIKSCMDMQMQLQQPMKPDIQKVEKEEKKSPDKALLKKGNCCICYEVKVDSLLYRCGHMCACLKCANELQWNGGKCPICRAKIVDVVRVFVDG